MTSKFMTSPRFVRGKSGARCRGTRERPGAHRFGRKRRYVSGYLNGCQPTPSIALGVYGVATACSRGAGAGALAAGFAAAGFAAAGFAAAGFLTDFPTGGFFAPTGGFFAAFFGVLFFFAGFAMPRNLQHRPSVVKPSVPVTFDQ
jgi:hypothetical protein